MDITDKTGKVINFSSDAAKSAKTGMGAVCNNNWTYGKWNVDFLQRADPSIEFLELYALTASLLTWCEYKDLPLQNNRVTVSAIIKQLCQW